MARDELTDKIKKLATGDNAETVASIADEVGALYDTIDAATKLHEQDAAKINQLNDTNMKLFLRVTGDPAKDPDPEPEQTLDDFVNTIKKEGL